jgi:hypothetical protein
VEKSRNTTDMLGSPHSYIILLQNFIGKMVEVIKVNGVWGKFKNRIRHDGRWLDGMLLG